MSLARDMLAARSVTSSIAARTVENGPSASIREIAADGAMSPARHCTRIAFITGGCTPSVRRLIASASRPVRLLMSMRLENCENESGEYGSFDASFLRHNMRQPDAVQVHHSTGGPGWLSGNQGADANTAGLHQSASRARCADARRELSSRAGAEGR